MVAPGPYPVITRNAQVNTPHRLGSMETSTSTTRLERWEHKAEWPMAAIALVFLAAYAIPIIWPGVSDSTKRACVTVMIVSWAAFGVDYAARLWLAEDRRRFVRRNLLDLAAIVLPFLRPLRLLRLVALLSILNRTASHGLRGRVVAYAAGSTTLLILVGGLAVTDAERGRPESNIAGVADGWWWAMTTITTVGYGDRFPVTAPGRFIAVALMVGGIAVLGIVTGTIASWLVQRIAEETEEEELATRAQVHSLAEEVRALRAELAGLRVPNDGVAFAAAPPPGTGTP